VFQNIEILNWEFTNKISDFIDPLVVTIISSNANQQVTNVIQEYGILYSLNALVGTPEAVCPPTNYGNKKLTLEQKQVKWNQWLAGLIDGDGCFLVSTKGYPSLEITAHSKDFWIMSQIKQHYGGSLKARAGLNGVRYRLHHREGILQLCADVNGWIRHPVRTVQFQKVLSVLCLEWHEPKELSVHNGWFAGMFDADGTVTLNLTSFPQITISVTQKFKEIPEHFQKNFGGSLYYDKSQNGYWTWAVQSKHDVLSIVEYFKFYPSRSHQSQKLHLIPISYKLIQWKAHLPEQEILHRKWQYLVKKWQAI